MPAHVCGGNVRACVGAARHRHTHHASTGIVSPDYRIDRKISSLIVMDETRSNVRGKARNGRSAMVQTRHACECAPNSCLCCGVDALSTTRPFISTMQTDRQAKRARMVTAAAAFAARLLLFTTALRSMSMSALPAVAIRVQGAGSAEVNGLYAVQDPGRVPAGFQRTCETMRWPPQATVCACIGGRRTGMRCNRSIHPLTRLYSHTHSHTPRQWRRLSNGRTPWFEKADECYVYFNRGDGQFWIDGKDGLGLYVARADVKGEEEAEEAWARLLPPEDGWEALTGGKEPCPVVEVVVEGEK